MKADTLLERFEEKYIPEPNSGCWLWVGSYGGGDRRGSIAGGPEFHGKNVYAHRASWHLFRGPIPEGLGVLHTCDVPICVNPDHLFLGTHLDNMRDCARKGRIVSRPRRGEGVFGAKLTSEQVSEIKTKVLTPKEYAARFGVDSTHINRIQRNELWKHVVPPFVVERPKHAPTPKQIERAAYMREWYAKRKAAACQSPA